MTSENSARISLRIQPGAPRNGVVGVANGVWKVRIAAPPVEGKANKELIDYLSEVLDVPKSSIAILRGENGREKVVSIAGMTTEEVGRRMGERVKE